MRSLLLASLFVFTSFFGFTQNDCKPYFKIGKGYSWEYEEMDAKGSVTGTNKISVTNVIQEGSRYVYTMKTVFDGASKKEEDHVEETFDYSCENGVMKMSMDHLIPKEAMEGMEDMEIEISQTEMNIPNEIKVGDQLSDASVTMKISMEGMTVMSMKVLITDRKVEKAESITTPAGTFSCVLITYKSTADMGMMKIESSVKEWWSPEVGLVKSEHYGQSGQLESKQQLKAYSHGS
ncbi:MAG: hypothetical protein H6582_11995 [Crocinitomicaceae bacterium]|nr:hypothetical protein [Crocinitomicaceae bacterium]